jgi:ubiquitin C-terminal hydrolase
MMTCSNCNKTTHNVQCFNILIFPLVEVRKYKNKYKLTNSYIEVLNNLWLNDKLNNYSLNNFKHIINEISPLFLKKQVNNSEVLVLFILETIHNELNEPNKKNIANSISMNDQFNNETIFNTFNNYFDKNYNSIISNLFYGIYKSMITCLDCNITEYNLQCFNILTFPLEEVRKYKNKLNNTVDIIECFEYYQKQNSSQLYCNISKTISNYYESSKLIIGPKVLVINLKRSIGIEFNAKLKLDEYLDIKDFINYYKKESPSFYELIGIVSYFESSNMNGHFIAFCKSFIDNQWYKYNDTQVNISSFQEAKSTGVPYILFYSFIKR